MLVLSRKLGEKIDVWVDGTRVEITLIEVRGYKARIGVHAPDEVVIHRREITEALERGEIERRPRA